MYRGALTATVMMLLLNGAMAAPVSDPLPGANPSDDPAQANWHGRDRSGGRGQGSEGGGADGSVIIGVPSESEAPPPYPPSPHSRSVPAQFFGSGNDAASQPRPWPVWYYCDQPGGYYPYVKICGHDWQRFPIMPPPPGSAPPIAERSWERCDDPAGYFPYVAECRHQWEAVSASIPVPADYPDGIPVIGQWYYCDDAKDYLPYVGSCPHVWRMIPAVPPPNVQSATKLKAGG
jgi:hypothetical protein